MSTVTIDDHEVRAAFASVRAIGRHLAPSLVSPVRRLLLRVQAQAQKLTPADGDRSLRRSAQTDVEAVGEVLRGKITFGGLASKYAEVQHEREDFAHTPAEYQAKYGKPLNRGGYTRQTLRGTRSKRGKITIKSRTWKYKRKHRITGYTGGQAHFLYGRDNSAWNRQTEQEFRLTVDWHILQQAERILAEGGRGA